MENPIIIAAFTAFFALSAITAIIGIPWLILSETDKDV